MANSKSALKNIRKNRTNYLRNRSVSSRLKTLDKAFQESVESKDKEVKMIKESNERSQTMDELLSPLQKDKAVIMQNLLENVQTSRLQSTFDKYLPAVLANKSVGSDVKSKKALTESKTEVTGDKQQTKELCEESIDNIVDIRRLAGL